MNLQTKTTIFLKKLLADLVGMNAAIKDAWELKRRRSSVTAAKDNEREEEERQAQNAAERAMLLRERRASKEGVQPSQSRKSYQFGDQFLKPAARMVTGNESNDLGELATSFATTMREGVRYGKTAAKQALGFNPSHGINPRGSDSDSDSEEEFASHPYSHVSKEMVEQANALLANEVQGCVSQATRGTDVGWVARVRASLADASLNGNPSFFAALSRVESGMHALQRRWDLSFIFVPGLLCRYYPLYLRSTRRYFHETLGLDARMVNISTEAARISLPPTSRRTPTANAEGPRRSEGT